MMYLVGTKLACDDWRVALDQAEGLPRRAVVVGGPDRLPLVYSAGAAGWTEHISPAPTESQDKTVAALAAPPEADRHLGKTVRVAGKDVALPSAASKVDGSALPQKLKDVVGATAGAKT